MRASWNQTYNLYKLAKDRNYPKFAALWETKDLSLMTPEKYRECRNALIQDNYPRAYTILDAYPEKQREGGEE
jgi:hypothetical protein